MTAFQTILLCITTICVLVLLAGLYVLLNGMNEILNKGEPEKTNSQFSTHN